VTVTVIGDGVLLSGTDMMLVMTFLTTLLLKITGGAATTENEIASEIEIEGTGMAPAGNALIHSHLTGTLH